MTRQLRCVEREGGEGGKERGREESEERRVHIGGVSTICLYLSLQIWDLRNMRSPVDSIRQDCGVNRLSVSHDERGLLAVPLDNRHIKLYDLTGSRVAHLPRRNRQVLYSVRLYFIGRGPTFAGGGGYAAVDCKKLHKLPLGLRSLLHAVDPLEPHISEPTIIRTTKLMIFIALWCASNRTYFSH